jgi:OOP family OmpA-OmpF porin
MLKQAVEEVAPAPAVMPTPPPSEAFPAPIAALPHGAETPVDEMSFLVFFDWDKYSITPGAYDVLEAVLTEIKSHRGDISRITIDGYTDTSGGEKYNMKLSVKRADAVRSYLVKHGISAKKIHVVGHGEKDLLVATPHGVREPQNRRAQITFE